MIKFKASKSREKSEEPLCTYDNRRVTLTIVDSRLQLVEKKFISKHVVLEIELNQLEEVSISNGSLIFTLDDGSTLSLLNCQNVENIVEYAKRIIEEKAINKRIVEYEKKLYSKALEAFYDIKRLVVEVYPAIVDVARMLRDIPNYEGAIGKANHLASLVDEAADIVRALRAYDSLKAHRLLVELSKKLYEDTIFKIREVDLGKDVEEYLLKALDLGVLLNVLIAKIYVGKNYKDELEKAKILTREVAGFDPGLPETPRPEHLYDKLSNVMDRVEEKFKELAKSKAHEEAVRTVREG